MALCFRRTYGQTKPNPYVLVRREDCELHFFGMADFDPANSYGSCIVQVPDTGALHKAFAAGLRAAYGKVPVAGIPRMTRPRRRRNADNLSDFTVVDPGGNCCRSSPPRCPAPCRACRHGDVKQAAKILDGALSRSVDATVDERVEALAYRVELAVRLGEETRAAEVLAELRGLPLTSENRTRLAEAEEVAAADRELFGRARHRVVPAVMDERVEPGTSKGEHRAGVLRVPHGSFSRWPGEFHAVTPGGE